MAGNSNVSSPDNNNYGGPQQAYKYQSLVETPSSPELANHRDAGRKSKTPGTPVTPPVTPEIIQPGLSDLERQKNSAKDGIRRNRATRPSLDSVKEKEQYRPRRSRW
jgi:hypothetical protein